MGEVITVAGFTPLTPEMLQSAQGVDKLNEMLRVLFSLVSDRIYTGTGTPENSVAAPVGSLFLRTDGAGSGATVYQKLTGTGNTGWSGIA